MVPYVEGENEASEHDQKDGQELGGVLESSLESDDIEAEYL
jgi:hypothetical protein